MELTRSDEQSYQLELHAYQIIFLDFKYEPLNFIFVEIGTSSKVLASPSMVRHVVITKPVSPLRSGIGLKIIPLPIQISIIHVPVVTIVNELMKGSERCDKE
jgi:hypothetical protein